MRIRIAIAITTLSCVVAAFAGSNPSQQLERELNRSLKSHNYIIRNFYVGKHLVFDNNGKLLSGGTAEDWTTARFQLNELSLKEGDIELQGHAESAYPGTNNRTFLFVEPEKMKIDIHLPSGNINAQEIDSILGRIFLKNGEPLPLLKIQELTEKPIRIGPGVTPPQPISAPDPIYSRADEKAHYHGTVGLQLVVDVDGSPRDVQVVRPLGNSLDQKAVDAVRAWHFAPAKKNGIPVPVVVEVQVDFNLSSSVDSRKKHL